MPKLTQGWPGLLAALCASVAFAQPGPAAWSDDAAAIARPASVPARPSPYARRDVVRLDEHAEQNFTPSVQPTQHTEPTTILPPPTAAKKETPPAAEAKPAGGIPLGRRSTDPPVPLSAQHDAKDGAGRQSGLGSLGTLAGSLIIVLTLFFVVMWLMRRAAPQSVQLLPGEVVEVLGRAPLTGRQQMHLLRCGRKLVLVSVTPDGAKTLTEITDPEEVDRLAGLCQQTRPGSATAAFRQVFQQFAGGGRV